jgi:hypothetical protein
MTGIPNNVADVERQREAAIIELRDLQRASNGDGDPEIAHQEADELLCALLRSLGFGDVVAEWEKVQRWYA